MLNIIFLVVGFIMLIYGANKFIDGASSIATKLKLPKSLVGLSIMAIGTSLPELFIAFKASIDGNSGILLGNVIGSNIQNILLILGIAAIIKPLKINKETLKQEFPILIIITIIFSIFSLDMLIDNSSINYISRSEGIILVILFSLFIYYIIKNSNKLDINVDSKLSMNKSIIYLVLGIVLLILGCNLVVNSVSDIASKLGISDYLISVTVVALGTSLPELVTTILAGKKKESELAIGNIIGSSIFNICIVLGLPVSIFGTIELNSISYVDIIALLISSLIIYLFAKSKEKINKIEGIIMLIIFVIYYSIIIMGGIL